MVVSNVHQGVSELQHSAANTYAIVSDIHRTVVKAPRGTDGENLLVSVTCTLCSAEHTLTVA